MATRAEGVKGLPALLCKMLWRTNFTFALEYTVYARGIGHDLVDYLATVGIQARIMEDGANPHYFEVAGTSGEITIQAVAYKARAAIHGEVPIMNGWPFIHFPFHGGNNINTFEDVHDAAPLIEHHMVELVRYNGLNCGTMAKLWLT